MFTALSAGFALNCVDNVRRSGTPGSTTNVDIPEPTHNGDPTTVSLLYVYNGQLITEPTSAPFPVPVSGSQDYLVTVFAQSTTSNVRDTCVITITVEGD